MAPGTILDKAARRSPGGSLCPSPSSTTIAPRLIRATSAALNVARFRSGSPRRGVFLKAPVSFSATGWVDKRRKPGPTAFTPADCRRLRRTNRLETRATHNSGKAWRNSFADRKQWQRRAQRSGVEPCVSTETARARL